MQRRKLLIGAGALAAGSAAAVGSGAFTAMQAGRDAEIDVVSDSEGLIALVDATDSDVVQEEDGQLVIDFTADGTAGVNVDSKYQAGAVSGSDLTSDVPGSNPTDNPAFQIVNNDSKPQEIRVSYELEGSLNTDGSTLLVQARPDTDALVSNDEPTREFTVDASNTNPSFQYTAGGGNKHRLDTGRWIGVSLLVDTTGSGATTGEDLSGTLTVSAGRNL